MHVTLLCWTSKTEEWGEKIGAIMDIRCLSLPPRRGWDDEKCRRSALCEIIANFHTYKHRNTKRQGRIVAKTVYIEIYFINQMQFAILLLTLAFSTLVGRRSHFFYTLSMVSSTSEADFVIIVIILNSWKMCISLAFANSPSNFSLYIHAKWCIITN